MLDVDCESFGSIGAFAIPEMDRFYRHVLIAKRYPHHGAVAFGHWGKALFEVFEYSGRDGHCLQSAQEPAVPRRESVCIIFAGLFCGRTARMRVKENYGRDAPSRIPAVRLELSEMRGRRFMAEIQLEKTALGLELGSTRIKAVLIGPEHAVLASGAHRFGKTVWSTDTGPMPWMTYGRACRMHLPGWPGRFRSGTARRCIPWARWVFPV